MARTFHWLVRGFFGLFVLALIALILIYYLAARSVPDYKADYQLNGLKGPVEIVRDANNVPHIFAKHDEDAYFGLGFTHAQDRLWQMTMLRRTAQGRLSELFGKDTLKIDNFVRRLDLAKLSRDSFEFQSEEVKAALLAYSAGVNAWLTVVQREALGRGAPEFFLFPPQIEPWTPADSLTILRAMALRLSGHMRSEVLRAQVTMLLGPKLVRDILPDSPGTGSTTLPEFAFQYEREPRQFAKSSEPHPLDPVPSPDLAGASNAWAAASFRSAADAPILANDPHLRLSAPSIWMLARLEFTDGGVIGGTIPGMPIVLSGRSEALGWGLTSSYLDDLDVYFEKVNPDNSDEYLTPDGYKPFRKQQVLLQLKGEIPHLIEMRWTDNGPVIPADQYELGSITKTGQVTSIRWAALDVDDQSMTAALNLMRAKSTREARDALALFKSPSQNVTLADKNGIMLQMAGAQPARNRAHRFRGRLPSRGWMEENRWDGYLPFSDNPWLQNPKSGIVANTNNKITNAPFPKHVSYYWGDTYRFLRLSSVLNDREVHTRDSFIEAQLDTGSFGAIALLPLVAKELWFTGEVAPADTLERQRQVALEMLAAWNGKMDEHIPEPLIYAAWMRQLQNKLIRDDLANLADHFARPDPVFLERVFRDIDGASVWCDIRQSTRKETCAEMSRIALDAAIIELSESYGERVGSWRWGEAHQAHHDHYIFGTMPLLGWFTNIRQETSGGDYTLMRGSTDAGSDTPYANVHGAGFRSVIDFSDPDSSVFIISTGQSGHFLSPHYDDLAQVWRRGEYIPMSLDSDFARSGAVGISQLHPSQ